MRRALTAGTITLLVASLPAASAVAHPCPCFPGGTWSEVELPEDFSSLMPTAAIPVADGVLTFGPRGEGEPLEAGLLAMPDKGDSTSSATFEFIPIELPLPDDGQLSFVTSNGSADEVLMGGEVRPPGASGLGEPFIQFSSDGGRTWQDLDMSGPGLDLIIDGAPFGDGFVVSGSVVQDGLFLPAVSTWDGRTFSPPEPLAKREGFGITVTAGPGDGAITVGGVLINDKDKQVPVVLTHTGERILRTNMPGGDGIFPTDIVASGNDIIVTNSEGQVLHASEPGGKLSPIKGFKGDAIHAFGEGFESTLLSFGKNGLAFSVDGGGTWARTDDESIAGAGTVKATGATPDGDFFAFSRGADDRGHLFVLEGPAALVPQPLDPQVDFARMMAAFFVADLATATGGAPTPEFVSAVTSEMTDIMAEYQADESLAGGIDAPLGGPPEGASAREVAENFVARLIAAGGSVPPADFTSIATGEIHAAFEAATGTLE